jgi:hypothetical protein
MMKRKIFLITGFVLVILAGLAAYAYLSTLGKTDLYFKIHINEKLVHQSGFGESPTFAIWLENPETEEIRAVYVTRRAAEGDWEGKAEVPTALPQWFDIEKKLKQSLSKNKNADGFSGATPKPGYFTAETGLEPGSRWICWIEVNLAGDFNDIYPGNINEENEADKFLSGQPAILYRADIKAVKDSVFQASVVGMTVLGARDGKIIQPLNGITTATGIFDEIGISIVQPKPKILKTHKKVSIS